MSLTIDQWLAVLNRADDAMLAISGPLADEAAGRMVQLAKQLAPVGKRRFIDAEGNRHPGWLRRSIEKGPTRVGARGAATSVEAKASYAIHVEFGTSNTAPQPFMRPAADQVEREFAGKVRLSARKAIEP